MANQFVVYQDERHGLGAWVAEQIAADLFRNRIDLSPADAGTGDAHNANADGTDPTAALQGLGRPAREPVASAYGMALNAAGGRSSLNAPAPASAAQADKSLDFAYRTWTSPRANAEATMAAVIGRQAQVGVLPLYDNDRSFDRGTLNALIDFAANDVVREYVADSNYVLAAPSDLVHEIEQSGYTDSFEASGNGAKFAWNRDKQRRYLRKVTTILASADAMDQCAAALDGFRAQGISVQQIPEGLDAYREGLRTSASLLDPDRRVKTVFSNNQHSRESHIRAANHTKGLIAVLLSADKAMTPSGYTYDSDYVILESEMAGADRIRSSFIAITKGIPMFAAPGTDVARFELKLLAKKFGLSSPRAKPPKQADHRALYPMPGDATKAGGSKGPDIPAYVRALYMVNTVGPKAQDISPVLRILTDQGFSYTTSQMDDRAGHPMIFSIDIPAERLSDFEPVLRKMMKLPGARRLAAFPAIQPMVKEAIRPKPSGWTAPMRFTAAFSGILVLLAAFIAWQLNVGG